MPGGGGGGLANVYRLKALGPPACMHGWGLSMNTGHSNQNDWGLKEKGRPQVRAPSLIYAWKLTESFNSRPSRSVLPSYILCSPKTQNQA